MADGSALMPLEIFAKDLGTVEGDRRGTALVHFRLEKLAFHNASGEVVGEVEPTDYFIYAEIGGIDGSPRVIQFVDVSQARADELAVAMTPVMDPRL